MPVEIELGCYYNDWNDYRRAQRRGSQPLHSAPGQRRGNGCSAGSRGHAMRALAGEAHAFYGEAIKIFQRNEPEAKGELQDLYATVIRSSYENAAPNFGRSILRHLISTYPENSRERIETQVQLADWDLLYSVQTGKRVREAALAAYEEAYAQLRTNGVAQDSIDALFSPDLPILLPAFMPNPLVSQETPTSTSHIDIRFVVTVEGEGDDIEILDTTTADVPRAVRKDLADEIKRGRFRPILTDGRLARSDPFVVRYYLN